jgi:tetratricopeptide (TPR) repeat protein
MNWFTKLFKPKSLNQSDLDILEGCDAFIIGEKIWKDITISKGSLESKEKGTKEALKYFDRAIEKGYDDSEVFSLRGRCLNDLGFYFEALEDLNRAIQNNPKNSIAIDYHIRSIIKDSLFDFEGSLADIKEAVRLSKLDNDYNRRFNNYAKKMSVASPIFMYETWLQVEERNVETEKRPQAIARKNAALKAIKRREI